MSTTSPSTTRVTAVGRAPVTRTQKIGLVLAGLLAITNVPSVLFPTPDGAEEGPPLAILVVCSVLGVVATVGVVFAWRGSARWLRAVAVANVVCALTAVPAFFVGVPMWLKASVAVTVLLTLVSVALMFSAPRDPAVRVG